MTFTSTAQENSNKSGIRVFPVKRCYDPRMTSPRRTLFTAPSPSGPLSLLKTPKQQALLRGWLEPEASDRVTFDPENYGAVVVPDQGVPAE